VGQPWIVALVGVALVAAAVLLWLRVGSTQRGARRDQAIAAFPERVEQLESEFLAAAAATGKPRGLRWMACRLDGSATFAEDRVNQELYALVAATVSFAAIEGGGMEEVEAVSNLRAATAVFVHRKGRWTTDGRVVFNLDPAGALVHYRDSLLAVAGSRIA
jgi:hypothetical protein